MNLNPFFFLPDKYNRLMKRFCQFLLPALLLVSLASQSAQAQQTLTIQGERVIRFGEGLSGIVSFEFEVPPNQTDLDFSNFGLTSITLPEGLTNLETLNLSGGNYGGFNHLTTFSLPEGLTNLKTLNIRGNNLLSLTLPADLNNLETINLENNNLQFLTLPEGLASLKTLNLERNRLTSLTLSKGLTNLATLDLAGNQLKFLTLPEGLPKLETLDLAGHNLSSLDLPEGWASLKTLNLNGNGLSSLTLPAGLTNLTTLNLANNKLTSLTLPKGLTNLTRLELSGNSMNSLIAREELASFISSSGFYLGGFSKSNVTIYTPPSLSIFRMDGIMEITWNGGVLQSTTDLFGEWQDLESAESPLRILFPSESMRFFRLRL